MSNKIRGQTGIKGLYYANLPMTARNLRRLQKKARRVLSPGSPTEGRQELPTSCLLDVTGRTDTKSLFGV